ncbi:hypothetical protein [Sulfitobacter mediterraneus]|uniref:hypothetical protein n=1 Tax=Sulfitobacter mediterraneus TaxID=83219 RepID=UPI0021A553A6|nr:hypothetical protein [Sulfitobacter mediterraneus]UWR13357.1 hypothetical protein K3753_19545 [Sulfitobacter mediterraneus]
MGNKISLQLTWQDIPIAISVDAEWLGGDMVHLEFRASEPLPITSTGYRSHFMARSAWEEIDDLAVHVLAWLDEKAQSKAWQNHRDARRQPSLF